MNNINNFYKNESGFATLIIVVIFTIIFLLSVKGLAFLGASNVDISAITNKGNDLLAFTEGCVEDALRRIQIDPSYTTSSSTLSIIGESCIISIENSSGQKIITATGNFADYYKKVKVIASVSGGNITIDSWEELSE